MSTLKIQGITAEEVMNMPKSFRIELFKHMETIKEAMSKQDMDELMANIGTK